MKKKNIILSAAFLSGGVVFGSIGALTFDKTRIMEINNHGLYTLLTFLLGGYIIFSITCGIIVTAAWLSKKSLRQKIVFAVFWIIPIYSVFLGVLYSIPYFIYNIVKLKRIME